ncbi:hypothetical protein [Timonella senegalensis]|uniref:hypothetical protein n=1 Tax=Timonella senegalensis TaxID=1465825 RepID=UPI0028A7294B|nr:hypothetical protein [Timonella senegalensis]
MPYFFFASNDTVLIADDTPKWLYLIAFECICDAFKFIAISTVGTGLLIRVRLAKRCERQSIELQPH